MGLNVKRKAQRRRPKREKSSLEQPQGANQTWSLDFMSNSLSSGRKFSKFNAIDDFNREALAIEVNISTIPAKYVVRVLERLIYFRAKPKRLHIDNGPEFLAQDFVEWCENKGIEILYIQPGKPQQNAFIERFNGSFRRDVLEANRFNSLEEVRHCAENWRKDDNAKRHHETLNNLSPNAFAARFFGQNQAKA